MPACGKDLRKSKRKLLTDSSQQDIVDAGWRQARYGMFMLRIIHHQYNFLQGLKCIYPDGRCAR